jgi:uncharacterized protein YbcI
MLFRMKTKGQLEAEISDAIIRFEKEYMGRGPVDTRTYIIDDMVLVRLRGVLTPAEQQLVAVEDPGRGRQLVKQMRMELLENARTLLEAVINGVTNCTVQSMHTDISTTTGERIIIFVLDTRPEYIERSDRRT